MLAMRQCSVSCSPLSLPAGAIRQSAALEFVESVQPAEPLRSAIRCTGRVTGDFQPIGS
jgi:hypothetical protein